MKKAILVVSFGTSDLEARKQSLECIFKDLSEEAGGVSMFQAYTSPRVLKKLASRDIIVDTIDRAVIRAVEEQVQWLIVIPTHMIPGIEYKKVIEQLKLYEDLFHKITVAPAVLEEKEDCDWMVHLLNRMIGFCPEKEYILMGHGTEDASDVRYQQMNEAFQNSGFSNVRIVTVEGSLQMESIIPLLNKNAEVVLHPFMVVAGEHAKNDMAGEVDSFQSRLRENGFCVTSIIKGLGEYEEFRKLYREHLQKILL